MDKLKEFYDDKISIIKNLVDSHYDEVISDNELCDRIESFCNRASTSAKVMVKELISIRRNKARFNTPIHESTALANNSINKLVNKFDDEADALIKELRERFEK